MSEQGDGMAIRATGSYDATPEDALKKLEAHSGPVVIDFDETLFLTNSTTLFLATIRPSLMAYIVVKTLDVVKPWRFTGGTATRDAWLVRALMTLLPWAGRQWRSRAPEHAASWFNPQLVDHLRSRQGSVVISTLGFTSVVRPLVDCLGLNNVDLVSMGSVADRRAGKFEPTAKAIGASGFSGSLVLTDSMTDSDLLDAASVPLRVIWPDTRPAVAFQSVYFPMRYLSVVKRPGKKYHRIILKEDFGLWLVGTVWLVPSPITHVLALAFLCLSFWAIYEYGYIDNDQIADRHESEPQLSAEFHRGAMVVSFMRPLLWGVGAGLVGLALLSLRAGPLVSEPFSIGDLADWIFAPWVSPDWNVPSAGDVLRWGMLLAATAATFAFYNRIDKQSRILVYPVLQILRLGAVLVLAPMTLVATIALVLLAAGRSFKYYSYRSHGHGWLAEDDVHGLGLAALVPFLVLLAAQSTWSLLVAPATLSVVAWMVFLARHSIWRTVTQFHRIDRRIQAGRQR